MEAAGDSPDEPRSRGTRSHAAGRYGTPSRRIWPAVDPVRLVMRLLSDAGGTLPPRPARCWNRRRAGDDPLAPGNRAGRGGARGGRSPTRCWSTRRRTWSAGRPPRACGGRRGSGPVGHAVRAIGRRCRFGSVTVLGELAQGTTAWSAEGWRTPSLTSAAPSRVEELPRVRVPHEISTSRTGCSRPSPPSFSRPSVRSVPGSLRVRAGRAGGRRRGPASTRRWPRTGRSARSRPTRSAPRAELVRPR